MTQPTDKKPHAGVVHRASRQDAAGPLADKASTLFRVFECIRSLDERGIEPTRDVIAQRTQLPLTTVDDRIKLLRTEGLISAQKQCYRPLVKHAPARPVSATVLGDGMVKLDVGDAVLELTPAEAQVVGLVTQGFAMEAISLGKVAFLEATVNKQNEELRRLRRRLEDVIEVQAREVLPQPRLPGL